MSRSRVAQRSVRTQALLTDAHSGRLQTQGAYLCRGRVKEWCNVRSRVAQRSVRTQALLTDAHPGRLRTQTSLWQGANARAPALSDIYLS